LPSLQETPFTGWPPPHIPAEHFSPAVHTLLSSQNVPLLPGFAPHVFEASSHDAAMQTSAGGGQSFGVPPHLPAGQASASVQKSPSSQGRPSFAGTGTHPVCGSQTPFVHAVSS